MTSELTIRNDFQGLCSLVPSYPESSDVQFGKVNTVSHMCVRKDILASPVLAFDCHSLDRNALRGRHFVFRWSKDL